MNLVNISILVCMILLTVKLYSAPTLDETPARNDDVQLDRMEKGQSTKSPLDAAYEEISKIAPYRALHTISALQNNLNASRDDDDLVNLVCNFTPDPNVLLGIPDAQRIALKDAVKVRKGTLGVECIACLIPIGLGIIGCTGNIIENIHDLNDGTMSGNECMAWTVFVSLLTIPIITLCSACAYKISNQRHKCDTAVEILDVISDHLKNDPSFPDISHLTQSTGD